MTSTENDRRNEENARNMDRRRDHYRRLSALDWQRFERAMYMRLPFVFFNRQPDGRLIPKKYEP